MMGDILCTTDFSGEDWEEEIQVILQATAWALCSTIHTTAGYTPDQMAFSRDMIMQMRVNVNWQQIQQRHEKVSRATAEKKNYGR